MPLDVFATLMHKADNLAVDVMWQVCFWSTQVLTWLALPFFQVGSVLSLSCVTQLLAALAPPPLAALRLSRANPPPRRAQPPCSARPSLPPHTHTRPPHTPLPLPQVYADAGDFTVGARCWTSIRVRLSRRLCWQLPACMHACPPLGACLPACLGACLPAKLVL